VTQIGNQGKSPLVLVVDDDPAVRVLMREFLEQDGFAVEEAADGPPALSAFERLRPDIVLLDVVMPSMDGFAVCTALRKLFGGEHTPIVMVTGLDDIESINRAYEVGATDFITKPVNWVILGYRIRYILRASRAIDGIGRSEEKNRALLNAIPDLMLQISKDGTILDFKAAKDFKSFLPLNDLLGKKVYEILPDEVAQQAMHFVERTMQTGDTQVFEYQFPSNEKLHSHEARIVISGKDELLAIVRDITERKQAEEQIVYLAYHDTLTGLPNRPSFKERLNQALVHAKRYEQLVATLYLDLDRFKHINETFGHDVGDLLLKAVADRIVNCVRKDDFIARPSMDELITTVARIGGDEFTILLAEITHVQDAAKVARRILEALSLPFMLEGHEVFITVSIGIALYPFDGEDVDTLLENADTAMYHAKDQGKNNYQFYTQSMNATAFERFALENSLHTALDRQQFLLYYQPQLDIQTGKIVGMEALIRWQHPDMGLIAPAAFIPLAEETNLIVPIGEWVLLTACAQNKAWQVAGFPPMRVTVNLSGNQFRQKNLAETIDKVLYNTGLDPQYLELELTESIIMQGEETTITMLNKLKAMGIRLSIDDFGTGYSSLSYLKRFPLDTIKVDRSFVRDITTDPDDAAITVAIIALGHSLNLKVIAEGVETEKQLAFLSKQKCDEMQGYLFSPPVPAEVITQMLQERKRL
jgi:diguanylate cyclase (GGDEF)-like protein/PAS domain S-box-containing protein